MINSDKKINQETTPKDHEEPEISKDNQESESEIIKDNQESESEISKDNQESESASNSETIEDKLNNAEEKILRLLAEMENQRRRFEKERQEAFEFGGFNFAKESIVLLDNIDRATTSFKNDDGLKNSKDLNKILDGIEIVKKDLISIFKKNGIEAIDCINKKFDPNFHQAMLEVDSNDKEGGIIVQEIQRGYMMKSRLLRPTLVGVTKKSEKTNKDLNNNEK